MSLYLDFQKINTTDDEQPAVANVSIDTARSGIDYKYISLSKLDVDCSGLYLLKVPLQNPQRVNNTGDYKQSEGWYETVFKFRYYDYDNNGDNKKELSIYFKSNECEHYPIPYEINLQLGERLYDNHQKYFEVHNLNNLCDSINENIRNFLVNVIHWSQNDAKKYAPCFYVKDDEIIYNCLNNDQNNDCNHIMVDDLNDLTNDLVSVVGGTGYQKKFTITYSTNLSRLLLRPLMRKNINNFDMVKFSTTGITSYFEVQDVDTVYKILNFVSKNAFDYVPDIRQLIITSNLSVQPLYCNMKTKSYKLDDNTLTNTLSENIIYKMQINTNSFNINRLIFSQTSITNNYSILNKLTNTNFMLRIQFVDKYNNIIDYNMPPRDQFYVQLCAWSDEPIDGFFGRKRGYQQIDN